MCGITGYIRLSQKEIVNSDKDFHLTKLMLDSIEHRGPDGRGIKIIDNVVLGHVRLKVVDLDDAANQPFSDLEDKYHLVFNGEIYNYKSIKSQLISLGYTFRTKSDTEVLLLAYKEWNINCVKKFEGMFAFVLYDSLSKITHIVRDRLGKKPLFYTLSKNKLIFGSEIKSILVHGDVARKIDFTSLDDYLSLNYCIADKTLIESVKQVLPGERFEVNLNGEVKKVKYWSINFKDKEIDNEKNCLIKVDNLIDEAVSKRLYSDVPLGSFLSGGLDSSIVSYYASKKLTNPLQTFSIGFEERSYDESHYAKIVSKKLDTFHTNINKIPVSDTIIRKIVHHAEEPTADASMVPMYFLSKMARENVTVCLSGDGADELFAGYETYTAYHLAKIIRILPKSLRKSILPYLINLMPVSYRKYNFKDKLSRFFYSANFPGYKTHFSWRNIFSDEARNEIYTSMTRKIIDNYSFVNAYEEIFSVEATDLSKMLFADVTHYLPNDMLIKVDRMSMANSLEVRSPFLDHKVVEQAFLIPDKFKLRNFYIKKYILKKLMRNRLPNDIIHRKKSGFNSPIASWLNNELKESVFDNLLSDNFINSELLKKSGITNILNSHYNNKTDNSYKIWSLYILSLWYQEFMVSL